MSNISGLEKLQRKINTSLAADGKENYVKYELDEDKERLIIRMLTDKTGSLQLTTGNVANILRFCYKMEGEDNNVWVSAFSTDQHTIIIRTHPNT